ncbi:hypothetical protein EC09BKT24447_1593 [Escherichia coli 09BKT024447]|nr:hypothetical protein EC09BKT24447_1593 [Escherichia coli 09BKT024447]
MRIALLNVDYVTSFELPFRLLLTRTPQLIAALREEWGISQKNVVFNDKRFGCVYSLKASLSGVNRPGFPGECFICELRLPDHRFRWKHNKLFLLLPEEYGPAFPAIVDCYTSPPT